MLDFLSGGLIELLKVQKPHRKIRSRRKRKRFRCRIYWRDRGLCQYCDKRVPFEKMTLDHIVPLVAGGSDRHKENFCTACKSCNEAKAQLLLEVLGDLAPEALKKKFAETLASI